MIRVFRESVKVSARGDSAILPPSQTANNSPIMPMMLASAIFPLRTAAGVAAACAGDWSAAEQHHLTAIHHTDTAPYRASKPMAREWYATMLRDRRAAGDIAKALGLLREAHAMYESMGMPFHSSRVSGTLAKL